MAEQETMEIEVKILRISPKAYLVEMFIENEESAEPKKTEEWIPKSQVVETDCLAEGDEGTMEITEWIAKQKGLLGDDDE